MIIMKDVFPGVLLLLIITGGFLLSWVMFRAKKYTSALLIILFCGIILRIFVSSDHYLHEWDEKYHALVSKNLIHHPLKPTLYDNPVLSYDYKTWTDNHIWLEKPPVPLWFMASSIFTFGNNEFAVRFPSLIFSVLAIYLTYLLGCYLFDKKTGLLAAFFHSIHGIIIEVAGGRLSSDHVETCFIFFIELAILLSVISIIRKGKYYIPLLIGVCTGLAILSKWFPALIVFPVWLSGVILSRKFTLREGIHQFLLISLGCIIVVAPWLIYILNEFPEEAKWVIHKFLFAYSGAIEGHSAPFWYYLNYVEIIYGELVYIPLLFAIYYMMKDKKEWALKLLSVWWILPVIIFSFGETKRHTYLLLASPAFFLISSWFFLYLLSTLSSKKYIWIKYILLFLLIVLPFRLTLERINPFTRADKNPQWAKDLRLLNQQIPEKKVLIFNSERPIETMFYTNFIAYPSTPDSQEIKTLSSKGYTIYIYQNKSLKKFQ
jgi:4-amino-4-deoxy-L-arabinose transferase-like glycosyltransferase